MKFFFLFFVFILFILSDRSAVLGQGTNSLKLPKTFDWRRVPGSNGKTINYCTEILNQHLPVYCGSCWAYATTSSISDRFKIMYNNTIPDIRLSVQYLLNCHASGGCGGGCGEMAYEFMKVQGVVDNTCCHYQAKELECTAWETCRSCFENGCTIIEDPPKYYITEWGEIQGEENIKNEVLKNGPVSCSISTPDSFKNFNGGDGEVYVGPKDIGLPDHVIAIVGWGYSEKIQRSYWIVRNSWGTFWNQGGWVNIVMGEGDLGITVLCNWGKPKPLV
ncbi:hypothetical protein M0813_22040 [Anaeramoeba flamelloides]|uniref:Peptidase C1A papain C-terminal domain-containing protein n=1 Tax=Anaeramoeba flamelloides TaxID=1746091 RepID=A0ABQ8YG82_9EUKA|nr:hypothetical protein M0813_22040 [Anaeramoeba flamelloides]